MGCFLGCFGFTKKRKRPKFCNIIVSPNQKHARYVPLDPPADVSDSEFEIKQKFKTSDYEHIDKGKEPAIVKIKKKVRFNLNVKTYEPIQNDEIDSYLSEGEEEETKWEFNEEETQRATTMFHNRLEKDTMLSRNLSYPADYRYRNCSDGYDDEDEIVLNDFDDDDDDDDDEVYDSDSYEEEEHDQTINDAMLAQPCSVLKPIENLSHWKAVIARSKLQMKHQQENIMFEQENGLPSDARKNSNHVSRNDKPLENENAVNSSLSNWLFSSEKDPVAKI